MIARQSESPAPRFVRGVVFFLLLATAVLLAIATLPALLPQDTPAHIYTSQLLARIVGGDEWTRAHFELQPFPVPNLLAQSILALLTTMLPARVAGAVMTALTFAGFAAAILWLRASVRGEKGFALIVPFAVLLSLGRLWLLGFQGFLLGAAFFCLVCGCWWRWRAELSLKRVAALSLLLLAAWFSHLVSFGASVIALAILTLTAQHRTSGRTAKSAAAVLPSVPLAIWYAAVMAGEGSFAPHFLRMKSWSFTEWLQYVKSIKLLSIAKQTSLPFVAFDYPAFAALAPAVLIAFAVIVWSVATRRGIREEADERDTALPWVVVAIVLLLGGILSPDSFGERHGGFLRERLFLLGLVSAAPAWSLRRSRAVTAAAVAVTIGCIVQIGFVWEYGLVARGEVAALLDAARAVPERSRVLVIHEPGKSKFRASPTRHAANLVAADRDLVLWNNYQANLYFFPVNFRQPFERCSEDGSCELARDAERIDAVVVWGGKWRADEIAASSLRLRYDSDGARLYVK